MITHVIVGDPIELIGGDAGSYRGPRGIHGICGDPARNANLLNRFLVLDVRSRHNLGAIVEQVLRARDRAGNLQLRGDVSGNESAKWGAISQHS